MLGWRHGWRTAVPHRGFPGPTLECFKMATTDNRLWFQKVESVTHHDPATGRTRSWNTTEMFNYAVQFPNDIQRVTLDIEPHIVEVCRAKRGVE
jgi:hypothetical protein